MRSSCFEKMHCPYTYRSIGLLGHIPEETSSKISFCPQLNDKLFHLQNKKKSPHPIAETAIFLDPYNQCRSRFICHGKSDRITLYFRKTQFCSLASRLVSKKMNKRMKARRGKNSLLKSVSRRELLRNNIFYEFCTNYFSFSFSTDRFLCETGNS
jgi:hypothetical protein